MQPTHANFLSPSLHPSFSAITWRATIAAIVRGERTEGGFPLQISIATCPHCRARLGLRTSFTLAELWDPRTAGPVGLRFDYLCYQCGSPLAYPLNTALSFIALAILPLVTMGFTPELKADWSSSVGMVLIPYLGVLASAYSCLATPMLSDPQLRRKR
jgi:hypothetical protein